MSMSLGKKVTWMFHSAQGGASISLLDVQATDITQAKDPSIEMGKALLSCMGTNVSLVGIRISDQDTNPKISKLISNNPQDTGFKVIRHEDLDNAFPDGDAFYACDVQQSSILI